MPKLPISPDLFDRHAYRLRIRDLGDLAALTRRGGRAKAEINGEIGGESCRQTLELVTVPMPYGAHRASSSTR